jgi:hypothetical protein
VALGNFKDEAFIAKKARDISTALEDSLRETSTGSRLQILSEFLEFTVNFSVSADSGVRLSGMSEMSDGGAPASTQGNYVAFPACVG